MKKFTTLAIFLTAILSSSVYAGLVSTTYVYVGTTIAYGNVKDARYSSDSTQRIGCSVSTSGAVSCYAANSSGTSLSCYVTDASDHFRDIVTGINEVSYISFSKSSSSSICTSITVANRSNYL